MINLEKGGRVNLSKDEPSLRVVRVGLGWDANKFDNGVKFDLDVSAFILNEDKLLSDSHFIFYNNLKSPNGSVVHKGDERTGAAAGDDETITVDLGNLDPNADEISFIVTIHGSHPVNGPNFGQVKNSYIKLYDDATGVEVAKYELEDDFSMETAVQFGSLYKKNGQWLFKAVGGGFKQGLGDFVQLYGGNV